MITNAGRGAKARIMVEKWAGNFGTVQDRAQGRRTLEFDGDLFDTIDHVSLSLGVVTDIANLMGGEGWGIEKPSGFNKIVELIIEAARRVIEVMHQKNQDLQRQLTDIQDRKTENQEQHLPLPIFDLSVEMTELNKLSARYYATYAGCKAHALGLIMADMLSSEAREILIGMIMNGKSIDEIKEQVGNFEMSEQPEAVLSL